MLDALFRFFFELSPVVFSQGEFRFAATTGSYAAAAVVAVAAALAIYAYKNGPGRTGQRVTLAAIRLAILAIILVCLFRPLLVVRAAVPQQNFLGVLLDDSRSMQIADENGQPRSSVVKNEFGAADRGLLKALSERDRKSTRLNSSHVSESRMPSSA